MSADTRRKTLILLAAIFVCFYALGVMLYDRSIPDLGIRCAFTPIVNRFDRSHLFPADQEPLRPYDKIVKLGDKKIQNWPEIQRELLNLREPSVIPDHSMKGLDTKFNLITYQGETLVRVVYERGDQTNQVWVRVGEVPLTNILPTILWFISKAGLFFIGALLFWFRPNEVYARQFFIFCVVSCGAYLGGYHWTRITTQPVLILVFMVCSVMLPPVCLHFYLLFPRKKRPLEKYPDRTLLAVYALPTLFLLFFLFRFFSIRNLFAGKLTDAHQTMARLMLQEMLIGIYIYFAIAGILYILSIATLIHSFRTASTLTERNQVKWILFGSLATLIPLGRTLFMALNDQAEFGGGGATLWMFLASVFVTVAFAISITRYRLMELDQLLSSSKIYLVVSALAALVFYALVLLAVLFIGGGEVQEQSYSQVLAIVSTVLVLIVVDLIRNRTARKSWDKHQLDRTLKQMSESIGQLVDTPALARRLLQSLTELLGASRGVVFVREGNPSLYRLTAWRGEEPSLKELPPGCPLLEALTSEKNNWQFSAQKEKAENPAERQLHFLGGQIACALTHEKEVLALLILGPRDRGRYNEEDFHLLTAFAQVSTLALVSGEAGQTIDALNREVQQKVEKIAEQQRRILLLQSKLTKQERESTLTSESPPVHTPSLEEKTTEKSELFALDSLLIGSSPEMQTVHRMIKKVASSDSAVLLRGESGTGKELLAEALHRQSNRADKPFVKVHCAALAPTLLESELFGHIKGAFTSAVRDRVGRFELANGGTLFLDEIGDISLEVQTKLLRVLQEMSFERVGSSESIHVDVRIITATHQDLEKLIREGKFREDLFYRLNVLPIQVPPLRERAEDVVELIQHFLRQQGGGNLQMDDEALAVLKSYHWPGNVRQLENVIERALVISDGRSITVDDLPVEVKAIPATEIETETIPPSIERAEWDEEEREQLVLALAKTRGNKSEAARSLGLPRSTFVSRLKKHGLT